MTSKTRNTLKTESFRRLLRTYMDMMVDDAGQDAHRLAWYLANDLYDKLRAGDFGLQGLGLQRGEKFNPQQRWWSTLIAEAYPDTRTRQRMAYELVAKTVSMLRYGRLSWLTSSS